MSWLSEFRVLGPIEVRVGDRRLDAGTAKQRAVLAALLIDAGRPVSAEALIDRVWDESPPAEARNVLFAHLSRIRRVLAEVADVTGEPASLDRGAGGYAVMVDPDQVDLHRFRRLVEQARAEAQTDERRAALLREAISLWRGDPLAGLPGEWVALAREGLRRQRLDAVVSWAQVELRLGRYAAVIDALRPLVADNPLVEPLSAQLMRALYADGRAAEALDLYAATRRRMSELLGVEPGAELQELHRAVLRGEVDVASAAPGPAARPPSVVPAQLPLDVPGFVGRGGELARLDELLDATAGQAAAVVISAISGTAGVGKTSLAVHWAHRVRDRFPDGQLYVNLRGFGRGGAAMDPGEVLRGFLDALEVPAQRVPATVQAQVGLYRSLLAGKRLLIVLDNARDAEQVRPLLPGAPGCLAVVTSRSLLAGLVAAEGAHPLVVDLLSTDEARQLLDRRLGAGRVPAEPAAVAEIIDGCAGLPLALAIVAARAATDPQMRLTDLAGELRDTRTRLDVFAGEDPATDVRVVFSWSYRTLSAPAARLFRLLGLHAGPDIAAPAAASLAGIGVDEVRGVLGELVRAHLVEEHSPDRFAFHDLLRAYAAELAHALDREADRRAAIERVLDHYLHTGHAAAQLIIPHRDPITLAPARPGVSPEVLTDHVSALAWFTADIRVLLAVIAQAADARLDMHTWQLAWTLAMYFDLRGRWHDRAATQRLALDAAARLGDRSMRAGAHRSLGRAYSQLGRYDEAHTEFANADQIFRDLDDHLGQAHTHFLLARSLERQGRLREALDSTERAHDLFRTAGHRAGQARTFNVIGWYHAQLGDCRRALEYGEQALALQRELGDRYGQAATLDTLGFAHHLLGHHRQAVSCYQQSLELHGELGDAHGEAVVLRHLGDVHEAAGDTDTARETWQRALTILDQLGHPDADDARIKLNKQ